MYTTISSIDLKVQIFYNKNNNKTKTKKGR